MRSTLMFTLALSLAAIFVVGEAGATPQALRAQALANSQTVGAPIPSGSPERTETRPVTWPIVVTAVASAVGMVTGIALLSGQTVGPVAIIPGLPATVPGVDVQGIAQLRPAPFDARGISFRVTF